MRLGILGGGFDREALRTIAEAADERGIDSMWVGQHTHIPVGTKHRYNSGKYAGLKGGDEEGYIPEMYKWGVDPYVVLGAAAMVTERIRLGTCIALPAEFNPIPLAKSVSTLDNLSGGRFEFGIGYGWNPLEMLNNGVDPDRRRSILREKILTMRALWTEDVAEFDGDVVHMSPSWQYPKPVQKPHPPILMGAGYTKRTFTDIIEFCDGWIPTTYMAGQSHEQIQGVSDELAQQIALLRSMAEDAGRDPATINVTVVRPLALWSADRGEEDAYASWETQLPDDATVDTYRSIGVDRIIFPVLRDDRLADCLDRLGELMLVLA